MRRVSDVATEGYIYPVHQFVQGSIRFGGYSTSSGIQILTMQTKGTERKRGDSFLVELKRIQQKTKKPREIWTKRSRELREQKLVQVHSCNKSELSRVTPVGTISQTEPYRLAQVGTTNQPKPFRLGQVCITKQSESSTSSIPQHHVKVEVTGLSSVRDVARGPYDGTRLSRNPIRRHQGNLLQVPRRQKRKVGLHSTEQGTINQTFPNSQKK